MKKIHLGTKVFLISSILLGLSLIYADCLQAKVNNNRPIPRGAALPQGQGDGLSNYMPDELIVKLKPGSTVEDIKELNDRYGVRVKEKVFAGSQNPEAELEKLKTKLAQLNSGHQRWYWQLDRNSQEYKDYLAKLEKEKNQLQQQIKAQETLILRLAARQRGAPQKVVAPSLENMYLLEAGKNTDIPAVVKEYNADPHVEFSQPNHFYKVFFTPNDPLFSRQWAHQNTQAQKAWEITTGATDVIIAIVDTGVFYAHPDLKNNIWRDPQGNPGKDFVDLDTSALVNEAYTLVEGEDYTQEDNDPSDFYGHGTHVAGIASAEVNNNIGVAGVSPNCKIMPVRAGFNIINPKKENDALLNETAMIKAIAYAADNGADIINMSFGGESTLALKEIIDYAYAKGVVLVAASGNSGAYEIFFPAGYDNVIAVGATGQDDARASFSSFGEWVDIAAPGVNIVSTVPLHQWLDNSSGYLSVSGTSMASPYAAGVAGLIKSLNPQINLKRLQQILTLSSDDKGPAGKDDYFGYGRVNAYIAAKITQSLVMSYPAPDAFVRGKIKVLGASLSPNGFSYELYYAANTNPAAKKLISSGTTIASDGVLGEWDTTILSNGLHILTLKIVLENKEFEFPTLVTVDNQNEPPVFRPIYNKGAGLGSNLEFEVQADDPNDPQGPFGKPLVYSASHLPPGAKFDPQTQLFSWVPQEADKGIYEVEFQVTDGVYKVSKKITITTAYIKETRFLEGTPRYRVSIYGDKAVWGEWKNGGDQVWFSKLIPDGRQETQFISQARQPLLPDIFDGKIVWNDLKQSGNFNFTQAYLYDTTRQDPVIEQITHNENESHEYVNIYGSTVLYLRGFGGKPKLYLYRIDTKEEIPLDIDLSNGIQYPDIYQDKIVWCDTSGVTWGVYIYDYKTKETVKLFNEITIGRAVIWGDRAAWVSYRPQTQDTVVNVYDILTGQKIQILGAPDYLEPPSIYGDKLVWGDGRRYSNHSLAQIFLFDIPLQRETQITEKNAIYPEIFEDKIVFPEGTGKGFLIRQAYFYPQIDNLTPNKASKGQVITIEGKDFGYHQEDAQVKVNNIIFPVASWSNTQISCIVPDNASSGLLEVTTLGGTSNGAAFDIERSLNELTAPTNLTAANLSETEIRLNWQDNSDNEAGFKIERALSQEGPFVQVGTIGANAVSCRNYNLTPNVTYYYRICAYNADADSGYSNVASVTTAALVAPANLTADSLSETETSLNWQDNSDNEAGFKIERALSQEGPFVQVGTIGANAVSCRNYNLTPNVTYYYRICAFNANVDSGYSNIASATTAAPPADALATPSNLTAATLSTTEIRLWWQDNSDNETGFSIERSSSEAGPFSEVGTIGANATTCRNYGLAPGTTYYYRVRAYNASGASAYTNTTIAKTLTDIAPPATPYLIEALPVAANQIRLLLVDNALNRKDGVKIERSSDGVSFTQIQIFTASGYFLDTNLTVGMRYYYRIRAYNAGGDSPYSQVVSAVARDPLLDTTLPVTPIVTDEVVSTYNKNHLSVHFTSEDRESGIVDFQYRLTQDSVNGAIIRDWTVSTPFQKRIGQSVTLILNGLSLLEGKTYYFSVRAKNGAGLWSSVGYSDGITVESGAPALYLLTVNAQNGNVIKKINGQEITSVSFSAGTAVELIAIANNGYSFNNWSGDASGSAFTTTVTMDANKTVTANFTLQAQASTITTQPQGQTVDIGASATFNISATGTAPLTYQWRKDGSALSNGGRVTGVYSPALNISNVVAADAGSYSCLVTNTAGSLISASASLTVTVAPPKDALAAPSNLTAAALSSTEIRLWWQDNSDNEAGFRVERSFSETGPFIEVGTIGANATTCRNYGLAPGTTYYYRIRAYNASGASAYTNTTSAKTEN